MSRKDYIKFAEMVRFLDLDDNDKAKVARDLCEIFQGDNPRFDRDRFLRAAKVLK